MKTLEREIHEFSFYEREKKSGEYVSNKCGRDFLYYALNFHLPEKFNSNNNPQIFEKEIGIPVKNYFAWTQIQFSRIGIFLSDNNLVLVINGFRVNYFRDFVFSILFSRKNYEDAIREVEHCIDSNIPVGIDISVSKWMFGLLDHVMFVYGYDNNNLYVFDTHFVKGIGYERTNLGEFVFKLPKQKVKERWTRFGRVWNVDKVRN